MSRVIGNVGMLDLTEATEERLRTIERIGNIGVVVYRADTAHLLPLLQNAGNIGTTMEIPEGYQFYNGTLNLNEAYLTQLEQPQHIYVNGSVVIDKSVTQETYKNHQLNLKVNGDVYAPEHIAGLVTASLLQSGGSNGQVHAYRSEPRFDTGKVLLTNAYLNAIKEPLNLVLNGVLQLEKDLDMELFTARIEGIRLNGKVIIQEEQSAYLNEKLKTLNGVIEVIPAGFDHVTKVLKLNGRHIRRFQAQRFYTKKPILIDADVTREAFSQAVSEIRSTSFVVCSEEIEDLVWERCLNLNTEVVSYDQQYVYIGGEETWGEDQLLAMGPQTNFIVEGTWKLEDDVTEETLKRTLKTIDLFGEIIVGEKRIKGILYPYLRVNNGSMIVKGTEEQLAGIGNVGMLSL
ncbi:hypothetical protein JCM10914A_30390 [Paenibacillus sp. JCM 10914]|uniref:hypothetical protein n=1 Tax=Paenibacillus sp. JCM 10914 TaxID=1236974 RepID=UPI0003CCAB75|nr:hypothetical protein [Paenibacillus sp. JCM 10914]GAE07176.1 hypothetical protein JCM10914_3389 [Paenibacillus sp. JCM 10914]